MPVVTRDPGGTPSVNLAQKFPPPVNAKRKLALERRPWAETYSYLVRSDRRDDGTRDLEHEAHAVAHLRSPILVRPLVGIRLQELVGEVPVSSVYLDAVKSRLVHRVPGRNAEQPHVFANLGHRQRTRCVVFRERDRARRHEWVAAFLSQHVRVGCASESPELEIDERSVSVHRFYDLYNTTEIGLLSC